jgi:hypothetical protein
VVDSCCHAVLADLLPSLTSRAQLLSFTAVSFPDLSNPLSLKLPVQSHGIAPNWFHKS